jgi:nucleoid DNA-binding protein
LNTREFIRELAERLDIPQREATGLIKATTDIMAEVFAEGKTISIQKLGSFSVKKSEPRKFFSPKLQKHVLTSPRQVLEFHPAIPLKEKMKNIRPS